MHVSYNWELSSTDKLIYYINWVKFQVRAQFHKMARKSATLRHPGSQNYTAPLTLYLHVCVNFQPNWRCWCSDTAFWFRYCGFPFWYVLYYYYVLPGMVCVTYLSSCTLLYLIILTACATISSFTGVAIEWIWNVLEYIII